MAASSNFEASGFTEAVMQTHFFVFCIFGEYKLSLYISTAALWLKKYDVFDFSRDHTIEVSRDFLGGSPSS